MEDQKKRRKMKKTALHALAFAHHSMEDPRQRSSEVPESQPPSSRADEEEKDEEDSPPHARFHSPKTTITVYLEENGHSSSTNVYVVLALILNSKGYRYLEQDGHSSSTNGHAVLALIANCVRKTIQTIAKIKG